MQSPTGIIPEELMQPNKRREVLNLLMSLPIDGKLKAEIYGGWAMTVGIRVQGRHVEWLKRSGVDGAAETAIPELGE